MEENQSIEKYLDEHRGRPTGDTIQHFFDKPLNFGINDLELEDYARKLKKYELIDLIMQKAKSLGKVTERNEEEYRQILTGKSIEDLKDFLENIKRLEEGQQEEPTSARQQSDIVDEGMELGE